MGSIAAFINSIPTWIWLGLIAVIFLCVYYYVNFMRFANVKKKMADFQDSLQIGDEVMMSSGIFGTIKKLDDLYAVIVLNKTVEIKINRFFIETKMVNKLEEVKEMEQVKN